MINFLGPAASTTPIMSTTRGSLPTYQDDLELYEEWPGDEWWPDYQAFYGGQDPGDDGEWWGDGGDYHLQAVTEDPDFEEDEKLKEALKTEKLAEGMASKAHRTWTEAQHFARECPDKRHPTAFKGYNKGKGKSKNGYYQDVQDFAMNSKGKGKKGTGWKPRPGSRVAERGRRRTFPGA